MKIGVDIRPFLKEETGVGVYFKNLLFSLARIDKQNEYYLFSSSFKDRFLPEKIPPFVRKRFRDYKLPVRAVNFGWYRFGWPPLDYFFRTKLDLTHSPTPLILPSSGKKIVTVYDLFFLDFPQMSDREARKSFARRIGISLEQADKIVTISRFTQDRLREIFPIDVEKVNVIYLGIDHSFWEAPTSEELKNIREEYNLPSAYLLFVGACEPRKNLGNLLSALSIIHKSLPGLPLILAGRKGGDLDNIEKKIKELELGPYVRILGYVGENTLRCLYRMASAFVFPSFCEGFGIPLLEAMASGVPIVTSNVAALPEVAAEAALYFDPLQPEEIAEKVIKVLEDESLRSELVVRGRKRVKNFSWEKTAEDTLRLYQRVYKS